jgi:ParB family chromosome partitioning protein
MEALREGKISEGHARAILSLKGMEDKQTELLRSIQNNGWTVRQAEQFANAAKKGADDSVAKRRTASETELTKQIGSKLGTKVQVKHTAKGGQLIIRFDSDEHLAGIAQKIESGL